MLKPDYVFNTVADIDGDFISAAGVRALILDIDNTLAVPDKRDIPAEIKKWIDIMKSSGVKMVLLSNNRAERISDFAESVGLPFVAHGGKPLKRGYREAAEKAGVPVNRCAAVGDQLFTDIWGGKNAGCVTVLTKPFAEDQTAFIKLKRLFERRLMKKYFGEG